MRTAICTFGGAMLLLASLAGAGWADTNGFRLELRVWYATEILRCEQQGSDVKVLETWRGTLTPGTVIARLDLPKMPMAVSKGWPTADQPPVRSVAGRRVVLFLKRMPERADPEPRPRGDWVGADAWWVPATAAAVWFEQGRAYAMQNVSSNDPLKMSALNVERNRNAHASEADFKRAMHKLLAEKDAMTDALKAKRVDLLESMVHARFFWQQRDAISALGQCGKEAVPTLRKLYREDDYFSHNLMTVQALAQACGDEVAAEMTALAKDELIFWKEEAAKLPVGWQGELPAIVVHQQRRMILVAAIRIIEQAHYVPARDALELAADFWASLRRPRMHPEIAWSGSAIER